MQKKIRCDWVGKDKIYIDYHDFEWGRPIHDDRLLFEFLILEGMQAGLSWITVLKKREGFKKAFDNFEAEKIARYTDKDVERLMKDVNIIRNKLKIMATITNAKAYLKVQKEFGSFDNYIWQFTNGKPIINTWQTIEEVPAKTDISDLMSKDLKKKGFKFIGSTICYAFMQAVGIVNDHLTSCCIYKETT